MIAAEVGHLRLAYDYLVEAALMDLEDLENNTRDGLHIASLAGTWMALVAGFGGHAAPRRRTLAFAPRLPERFSRLAFSLELHGRRLRVEIHQDTATYTLVSGEPLEIHHYREPVTVDPDKPFSLPIPAQRSRPAPGQPAHRRPNSRRRDGQAEEAGAVSRG